MDWNKFMMELQPTITNGVVIILGILFAWLGKKLATLMNKKNELMESQLTDTQRAFIQRLACEAVAFAAQSFKDYNGEEKLLKALSHLDTELNKYGIDLNENSIRSVIDKAYVEYKANLKPEKVVEAQTVVIKTQEDV